MTKALAVLAVPAALVSMSWTAHAEQLAQVGDVAAGKQVFDANCQGCHASDATGNIGPNIRGRDANAVQFALQNVGRMAGLSGRLSADDIANVGAYLSSLGN